MYKFEQLLERNKLFRMLLSLAMADISWVLIGYKATIIILLVSIYDELLTKYIKTDKEEHKQ
jgi:hypothetical protein